MLNNIVLVSHLALALGLAKSSHHLGELGVLFAFLGVIQRIRKCSHKSLE